MRHASLITVVCRDPARNRRALVVTTSIRSATPTNFIAGPLCVIVCPILAPVFPQKQQK